MKKGWPVLLAACLIHLGVAGSSLADDARVLPKGVWNVSVEDDIYFPITKRFNPDGDTELAGSSLTGVLGTNVIPGLAAFQGSPFNIPNPNIGASEVTFDYKVNEMKLFLARGLTDRLTIGAKIPYVWAKNDVTAALNVTGANIGINTNFNGVDPALNPPFLPLGLPGVRPVTVEDMQQYITTGLVVNGIRVSPGLGFKRVESWSNEGFGDIDLGLKYQYLSTPSWRLAASAGVRMPTGEKDDPYNLVDRGLGSGVWTGLFYLHNDYVGIKDLLVDATFRYFLTFSDSTELRVVTDPNQPLSGYFATVDRNLGDVIEAEGTVSYEFLRNTSFSATYKYGHGFKTKATVNGAEATGLENNSDYNEQVIYLGLGYNTLPWYLEKKFPVPMSGSIVYRNRFAGDNYILKSQYLGLVISFFF